MNRVVAVFSALALVSASACGTKTNNGATASPTPNPNAPVVSAVASVTSGMAPLPVQFTGVAAGGVGTLSYQWDFGDGADSPEKSPTHTYANDGTFTATFKATDSQGNFDTATVTIDVGTRTAPAVTAAADHTAGAAPMTVNFTASATGGTAPFTYSWNFGDGANATQQNPSHIYNTAGAYGAVVTVTDAASATASATVLIQVGSTGQPVVAISANPTSGAAPLPVTFTSQVAGGTGAISYAWDFGDGASATTMNANHTYTTNNTYVAKLTVTDAQSKTAMATVSIVVNNSTSSTQADFQISNFTASATGLQDVYEPNDTASYYLGDYSNSPYTITDGYLDTVDVTFEADVVNVGAATTDSFWVDFYPDQSIAPVDGDYGPQYQQVMGLAANATQHVAFTVPDADPTITTTSWVRADSLAQIDEMDETNNDSDGLQAQVLPDEDWFSVYEDSGFALTVDLTNLPKDYDIELYNQNGDMVGSSANAGTTAEHISYNTASTGLYFIRVFGYQGARDSVNPYTLTITVP